MNKLLVLLISLAILGNLSAQKKHKPKFKSRYTQKNWDNYRHEIEFGVGVTNYLGDLGGNDGKAAQFSPKDVEISQSRYGFMLAYRYNLNRSFAVRPQLFYGKVSGSDQLTKNPERNYRNLAFSSTLIEFLVMGEYHLLRADRGHRFYRKGVIGKPGKRISLSVHLGAGFFYYNPKYGGVELRPLSTEGQGLEGGPKPYKKMALAFPWGFSAGYQLSKTLRAGFDFTYRFTNTDYIDDVGGTYYNKEKIRSEKGDLAAEMSNRSDGSSPGNTLPGSPRGGNKGNDSYFMLSAIVTYTPVVRSHGIHKRRKRAKF
ncbi:MAG: hypothetical protein CL840_13625 [Crocinitomicaceae bacterium]|nr:hypothetical protein [Crocinitomicaceae bacterium]|tara:strand:+ start:901 stop:1842 length:942 start_codon:yes stop_codon:yes gene_type:complete